MTNYPGTTIRSIRIPDPLWHEFLAATGAAGENASSVVRGLVREWLDGQKRDMLRAWVEQDDSEGEK